MNKKGFLFVVTIFLVLTYILLSISVWVKGIETSERAYSEFYKESSVELAIEQITPTKLSSMTDLIMNRAMFRLNNHAIDNPIKRFVGEGAAAGMNENEYTRRALYELLLNGSANEDYFHGEGISQEYGSSLTDVVYNLNSSLLSIGVYVDEFNVTNFRVGQARPDAVNYSFDLKLGIRDTSNTSALNRTYHIANTVNITGLVDPALARESKDEAGDSNTMYRQFFFNNEEYATPAGMAVHTISSSNGGQGWFYGPVIPVESAAGIEPAARKGYILAGTYADIVGLTPEVYEQFGGLIVTSVAAGTPSACGAGASSDHQDEANTFNAIRYTGPTCEPSLASSDTASERTSLPFIISPAFRPNDAGLPECPVYLSGTEVTGHCVLFITSALPSEVADDPQKKYANQANGGVYGIEELRDFVMCGYYTTSPAAPSYLQHLFEDPYQHNDSLYGIETFVVGEYANANTFRANSKLDRELFNNSITSVKIRGMPGCRNYESCSGNPSTGIFAVSPDVITGYNLAKIACPTTGAGCD